MILEELFEEFILYLQMKEYSKTTITSYRGDFKVYLQFLDTSYTEHTIDRFIQKKIRQYAVYLKMKKYSPATIARKINCLRSFSKFCLDENYLTEDPMRRVDIPRKIHKMPIYLTNEELERFLAVSKKLTDKTVLHLFAFTGIRRQELINLTLEDVDLENRLITVRQGKGKKDRLIPINDRLHDLLSEYLKRWPPVENNAFIIGRCKQRVSKNYLQRLFHSSIEERGFIKKG